MDTLLAIILIGGFMYIIYVCTENSRLKGELNYKTMQEETKEYKSEFRKMSKTDIRLELIKITSSEKFKSLWNKAIKKYNENHNEEVVVPHKEFHKRFMETKSTYPRLRSDSEAEIVEAIHQYMAMIDMDYTCRYLALLDLA